MRKLILSSITLMAVLMLTTNSADAQSKNLKKEKAELKAISTPSDAVANLKRPENDKDHPQEKSRGDVYGDSYSDIIIDNWTGWYIDVYVDDSYRGSIGPWEKKVTWAVPGNTKIYAKATFTNGSYKYWNHSAKTGYEYTLRLNE
jgi:hypothetical protein